MIKIVGVRFRNAGKVYYFNPNDLQVRIGEHVIAETSKGLEYGTISTCTKMVDEELVLQPLRSLVRKATEEDEEKMVSLRIKEKEALKVCREKVREHELDMKMVDAEYSFDASKVLFYFTADGRVDFRNLVKDLAAVFHVRIELRQIGVRDETRMLGGIGICGRELCCATYLREFQPVSIKMAKEQNLSLNPAKISGTCGRLMCCLKNEEATYEFLNAKMPKMGEEAVTADGMVGKVVELDVLRQRVRVLFEEEDTKEIETFPVADLTFRPRKKKDPSAQGKKNKAEKSEPERKNGKPENGKNPEGRPESGKSAEGRLQDIKNAESRPENGKNGEGGPQDGKSAEGRVERGKNAEVRVERGKNAEGRVERGKNTESKPERGKNAESRPERGKNAEGKSEHGRNTGGKSQRVKNGSSKSQRGKGGEGRDDVSEKNDRPGKQERHEKQEHSDRKHSRHKKQSRPEGNAGQNGRDGAQGEGGNEENKGWSKKNRRNRPKRQNSENHQGSPAQDRGGNSAE